jgi:hypothetical protein
MLKPGRAKRNPRAPKWWRGACATPPSASVQPSPPRRIALSFDDAPCWYAGNDETTKVAAYNRRVLHR